MALYTGTQSTHCKGPSYPLVRFLHIFGQLYLLVLLLVFLIFLTMLIFAFFPNILENVSGEVSLVVDTCYFFNILTFVCFFVLIQIPFLFEQDMC